jgi:hypothetical protein
MTCLSHFNRHNVSLLTIGDMGFSRVLRPSLRNWLTHQTTVHLNSTTYQVDRTAVMLHIHRRGLCCKYREVRVCSFFAKKEQELVRHNLSILVGRTQYSSANCQLIKTWNMLFLYFMVLNQRQTNWHVSV